MPNFIQLYSSTDASAPTLNGTTGSLVALLDAVLVNGYSTASVSSITRSGTTVTVTLGSANTTLLTGNHIKFAGANQSEYNGTQGPITVTDSTHFTYQIASTPTSPATGTITYAKAPLAWEKAYSGTNKAAYRSYDNGSNRFYLRVLDTASTAGGAKEALVRGYESMSDVDTGAGDFPTVAQRAEPVWTKSGTADSTARAWKIIGDDKTVYVFLHNGTAALSGGFGHFNSLCPGDNFNTWIGYHSPNLATGVQLNFPSMVTASNSSPSQSGVARAYTQTGSAIVSQTQTLAFSNPNQGSTDAGNWVPGASLAWVDIGGTLAGAYPNPITDSFSYVPLTVAEVVVRRENRGIYPGLYAPLHNAPFTDNQVLDGVPGVGKMIAIHYQSYGGQSLTGQVLFDLTGPW